MFSRSTQQETRDVALYDAHRSGNMAGPRGSEESALLACPSLLVVVHVRPTLVSGTEHRCLPHERLQRRGKLWVVTGADDGGANGGWAACAQGVRAHLPEEERQELDTVGAM